MTIINDCSTNVRGSSVSEKHTEIDDECNQFISGHDTESRSLTLTDIFRTMLRLRLSIVEKRKKKSNSKSNRQYMKKNNREFREIGIQTSM